MKIYKNYCVKRKYKGKHQAAAPLETIQLLKLNFRAL